jgi:hypothetical protein
VNVKNITVPLSVWGRLASEADTRGVTVEDLLVSAINNLVRPKDTALIVATAARAGYTDGEIAAHTGLTRMRVAELRRRAGVKPNRDRGQRRLIEINQEGAA